MRGVTDAHVHGPRLQEDARVHGQLAHVLRARRQRHGRHAARARLRHRARRAHALAPARAVGTTNHLAFIHSTHTVARRHCPRVR